MRKPNGYGSIKKLSGNRRRPYVFLISAKGKQKPLAYFATHVEAEIYAADYNKKHNNKILHGHQITFSELYYRWLPFHIDKQSTGHSIKFMSQSKATDEDGVWFSFIGIGK